MTKKQGNRLAALVQPLELDSSHFKQELAKATAALKQMEADEAMKALGTNLARNALRDLILGAADPAKVHAALAALVPAVQVLTEELKEHFTTLLEDPDVAGAISASLKKAAAALLT